MAKVKKQKNGSREGSYRILYIIIAVIAAVALWSYITLVANPETENTVNNIPIYFVGEDSLTQNNLMLVSVNTRDLDLSFTGKWNTVSALDSSNVSATVDLSTIISKYSGDPGVYQLDYTLSYGSGAAASVVTLSGADYDYVTVTVEKTISRTISIRGSYDGTIAENCTAKGLEYSAQTVTVRGPQAQVEDIAYASAFFSRDVISSTVVEECELVLVSRDGRIMDSDDLVLSQNYVTLTVPVLMVKDIPLRVGVIYGRSNSSANTTVTIDPPMVTVSGDSEILRDLNEINIGTIDTTKAIKSGSQTFGILIPEGCTNVNNVSTATVRWEVSGLSYVIISVTELEAQNVTEGYAADFVTKSVDVKLRGTELDLNAIRNNPSCISVVADMVEQGAITGEFIVSPTITVEGFAGVDVIGDYEVVVRQAIAPPTPPTPPATGPDEGGDVETGGTEGNVRDVDDVNDNTGG